MPLFFQRTATFHPYLQREGTVKEKEEVEEEVGKLCLPAALKASLWRSVNSPIFQALSI